MLKPDAVSLRLVLTCALAAVLVAGGAAADDRDLLRESGADPYVFILFDTSGSMHWTPKCSQAEFDAGECDFLCPSGDCFAGLSGDDPVSKLHQAKDALYEVLKQIDGISLGFATYNQDNLRMEEKHWLYRVSDTQPDGVTPNASLTLFNGDRFPGIALRCTLNGAVCTTDANCGARGGTCEYEDVFGADITCDQGSNDSERGCHGSSSNIADMNDSWELRRAQRVPKLGRGPDFSTFPSGEIRDNFNTNSFANNDGTLSWSGSWIETDVAGGAGPTAGNAQISGGKLRLDDSPNSTDPVLQRQADLSSWSNGATLEFDWDVVGNLETNDRVVLDISSNGGSSWTNLDTFDGFTGPTSGSRSYDVSSYRANNTRIRFRVTSQFREADEEFRVDNLVLRPNLPEWVIYLRNNNDGRRYKFIYRPVPILPDGSANKYGNAKLAVEIEVRLCTNDVNACASNFQDKKTVYYDLANQYASWDNGVSRGPSQMGFFSQATAGDMEADGTCNSYSSSTGNGGWDGNKDTNADKHPNSSGYNLRWPTVPSPPPFRFDTNGDGTDDLRDFEEGDVIPLDWLDDHRAVIQGRLAPNVIGNSMATPDFGVATYLSDAHQTGESFLRLKDESRRPIIAEGSTPLGSSMAAFIDWYDDWEAIAEVFDEEFDCRKKFLMVLTDGDQSSCDSTSACTRATTLLSQHNVKTFVVAFGVPQGSGNTLTCMASNGGTGAPIYPQNKQDLVDELLFLFNSIKVASRAFASASVPTVQNETSDKIYLSTFTPLPSTAIWPGRINAFRKPLPLKADNTPDFDRKCGTGTPPLQAACHLWDAAEEILDQAPNDTEVASAIYKIGTATDERRVLYGQRDNSAAVPSGLRLFYPPTANTPEETDLWDGLGLSYVTGNAASMATARAEATQIIGEMLRIKEKSVPDPNGGPPLEFEYVLGDIFHADPTILSSPNNLIYFREDLHGYQAFADDHFWRRKMLAVAANDGQLHFFDAGIRAVVRDPALGFDVERFTDGTGAELFSYMPRMVMPIVREQAQTSQHVYSLDGLGATADVFIDPLHDGTNNQAADRGWRTVTMFGLREAGDVFKQSAPVPDFVSGYFALDVTQPDELFTPAPTPSDPSPQLYPTPVGQLVPSCMSFEADGRQQLTSACPTPAGANFGFPVELWTFTDTAPFSLGGPYDLDEEDTNGDGNPDGNGYRDLGETWSKPVIGRVRICGGALCDPATGTDVEERFVAIFGGGLASDNPQSSRRGAWLYMVDVETGRAIYKRQLQGGAAAAPTVLDGDRDGYFDTIYIGTTLGFIYKVDLTALDGSGEIPGLQNVTIDNSRLLGSPLAAGTSTPVERITDDAWKPFVIFSTGGRAIFQTATAFEVPDFGHFALAVGTGNRHNLWDRDPVEGRFYTFLDEGYTASSSGLPRTEANYAQIDFQAGAATQNHLLERNPGERGWVLQLEAEEKVITQGFALVGVLVFTSFVADPDPPPGPNVPVPCARAGSSRIFVVDAETADPFVDLDPTTSATERYLTEGDFTTSPYVDQTSTKNPGGGGKTTESDLDDTQLALQDAIRQSLMRFFPEGCRYNRSYSLTINASRSDTAHVRFATIPRAMCPIDWKEE